MLLLKGKFSDESRNGNVVNVIVRKTGDKQVTKKYRPIS